MFGKFGQNKHIGYNKFGIGIHGFMQVSEGGVAVVSRLYVADYTYSKIREIDPDTSLVISTADGDLYPYGIGCIGSRLFYNAVYYDFFYELDLDTKLQISKTASISTDGYGVGGTRTTLYYCDNQTDLIHILDPDTKLSISNVAAPGTESRGVGGMYDRVYYVDTGSDKVWEIDPTTRLPLSSVAAPTTSSRGIGGLTERLYWVDSIGTIRELDPDTKLTLSTVTSDDRGVGIGGTK